MIRHLKRHYHIYGWVLVFCALLYVGVEGRQTNDSVTRQARLGAQSHVALCALKQDVTSRVDGGRVFLRLSPAQRIAKYGAALGSVPAATIRASIANEEHTVRALATLTCP